MAFESMSALADNLSTGGKRPNNAGVRALTIKIRHQNSDPTKGLCAYFRLPNWLISEAGWAPGDRVDVLYDKVTHGARIIKVARGGRKLVPSSGNACVFQIRYYEECMPSMAHMPGMKEVEVVVEGLAFNF